MNAVSKVSAFPPTVQSGVPKLRSLPNGWSRGPIGRHLEEVRRPVSLTDDELYQLVTAKRARGGIVPREKLTGREISVKSQFRIEAGDFLISKRQIVHGACGLVPQELDGAIVSNEYAVLRTRPSIDPRFLSYLSNCIYFQQTCFHSAIGVHIEKMIFKLDKWLGWEFDLPPLPEQRKTVEILSTWDKAIETTERLLANAEEQKRALMQQLLTGKQRLKGFEGSEWRSGTLGDFVNVVSGPAFQSEGFAKEGLRLLRGSNVKRGMLDWSDRITEFWPNDIGFEKYHLQAGDIVIAMDGYVGPSHAFFACNPEPPVLLVQRVARLRTAKAVPVFVYAHISSDAFIMHCEQRKTSTAIAHITMNDIREFPIVWPTFEEQKAIGLILTAATEVVDTTRSQLEKLQSEKHALMQQLLTGKRRVTV